MTKAQKMGLILSAIALCVASLFFIASPIVALAIIFVISFLAFALVISILALGWKGLVNGNRSFTGNRTFTARAQRGNHPSHTPASKRTPSYQNPPTKKTDHATPAAAQPFIPAKPNSIAPIATFSATTLISETLLSVPQSASALTTESVLPMMLTEEPLNLDLTATQPATASPSDGHPSLSDSFEKVQASNVTPSILPTPIPQAQPELEGLAPLRLGSCIAARQEPSSGIFSQTEEASTIAARPAEKIVFPQDFASESIATGRQADKGELKSSASQKRALTSEEYLIGCAVANKIGSKPMIELVKAMWRNYMKPAQNRLTGGPCVPRLSYVSKALL